MCCLWSQGEDEDVTWEGAGWRGCGHSDGNTHTAAPAVFTTAAAAAGMTAATAPTAEHMLQITYHMYMCLMLYLFAHMSCKHSQIQKTLTHTHSSIHGPTADTWWQKTKKKQQHRLVQWQREWDGRICEIKKERRSNSRDFVARKSWKGKSWAHGAQTAWNNVLDMQRKEQEELHKSISNEMKVFLERETEQCQADIKLKQLKKRSKTHYVAEEKNELSASSRASSSNYFVKVGMKWKFTHHLFFKCRIYYSSDVSRACVLPFCQGSDNSNCL